MMKHSNGSRIIGKLPSTALEKKKLFLDAYDQTDGERQVCSSFTSLSLVENNSGKSSTLISKSKDDYFFDLCKKMKNEFNCNHRCRDTNYHRKDIGKNVGTHELCAEMAKNAMSVDEKINGKVIRRTNKTMTTIKETPNHPQHPRPTSLSDGGDRSWCSKNSEVESLMLLDVIGAEGSNHDPSIAEDNGNVLRHSTVMMDSDGGSGGSGNAPISSDFDRDQKEVLINKLDGAAWMTSGSTPVLSSVSIPALQYDISSDYDKLRFIKTIRRLSADNTYATMEKKERLPRHNLHHSSPKSSESVEGNNEDDLNSSRGIESSKKSDTCGSSSDRISGCKVRVVDDSIVGNLFLDSIDDSVVEADLPGASRSPPPMPSASFSSPSVYSLSFRQQRRSHTEVGNLLNRRSYSENSGLFDPRVAQDRIGLRSEKIQTKHHSYFSLLDVDDSTRNREMRCTQMTSDVTECDDRSNSSSTNENNTIIDEGTSNLDWLSRDARTTGNSCSATSETCGTASFSSNISRGIDDAFGRKCHSIRRRRRRQVDSKGEDQGEGGINVGIRQKKDDLEDLPSPVSNCELSSTPSLKSSTERPKSNRQSLLGGLLSPGFWPFRRGDIKDHAHCSATGEGNCSGSGMSDSRSATSSSESGIVDQHSTSHRSCQISSSSQRSREDHPEDEGISDVKKGEVDSPNRSDGDFREGDNGVNGKKVPGHVDTNDVLMKEMLEQSQCQSPPLPTLGNGPPMIFEHQGNVVRQSCDGDVHVNTDGGVIKNPILTSRHALDHPPSFFNSMFHYPHPWSHNNPSYFQAQLSPLALGSGFVSGCGSGSCYLGNDITPLTVFPALPVSTESESGSLQRSTSDSSGSSGGETVVDSINHSLRVTFNASVVSMILYAIVSLYFNIKQDIDSKVQVVVRRNEEIISRCQSDYKENRCGDPPIPPYLQNPCSSWEKCMNQDPLMHGEVSQMSAKVVADIVNTFISQLEWRTMIALCVAFLVFFVGSNWVLALSADRYRSSTSCPSSASPKEDDRSRHLSAESLSSQSQAQKSLQYKQSTHGSSTISPDDSNSGSIGSTTAISSIRMRDGNNVFANESCRDALKTHEGNFILSFLSRLWRRSPYASAAPTQTSTPTSPAGHHQVHTPLIGEGTSPNHALRGLHHCSSHHRQPTACINHLLPNSRHPYFVPHNFHPSLQNNRNLDSRCTRIDPHSKCRNTHANGADVTGLCASHPSMYPRHDGKACHSCHAHSCLSGKTTNSLHNGRDLPINFIDYSNYHTFHCPHHPSHHQRLPQHLNQCQYHHLSPSSDHLFVTPAQQDLDSRHFQHLNVGAGGVVYGTGNGTASVTTDCAATVYNDCGAQSCRGYDWGGVCIGDGVSSPNDRSSSNSDPLLSSSRHGTPFFSTFLSQNHCSSANFPNCASVSSSPSKATSDGSSRISSCSTEDAPSSSAWSFFGWASGKKKKEGNTHSLSMEEEDHVTSM